MALLDCPPPSPPPAPSILSDRQIRELCRPDPYGSGDFFPMIEPFVDHQVAEENGERIISYGLSSFGYDIRLAEEFKVFTNVNSDVVDPKNVSPSSMIDHKGPTCIIPPNSFALARSKEYVHIPRDVLVVCLGKSTYARVGVIANVTPLEPEWEGHITLEFSNTTPCPVKLYANEGCVQLLFFRGERCERSYRDRGGKYLGQTGITLARV